MKVLFLTTHLNYGGISSYTLSLAHGLVQQGHQAYIASGGGMYEAGLAQLGITHLRLPMKTKSELNPWLWLSAAALLRFVRAEKIDVIHAQTRVSQVMAAALSRATKIPYITTCHGFFRRNLGRQIFPCWGDRVIAVSTAVRKHLIIDFFVPEKNVVFIPNGIDVRKFRVASRRSDPEAVDRTVGIVARLSPVKGHIYLIDAMASVVREFPAARLFIFGEGLTRAELVHRADSLGISEHVFFLPAVSHTADVLQDIDIFVMPSLQEGLGLSILEAQASGLPVIAANVGGIPNVIKNDLSGLLIPTKDAAAIAAAILKIMQDRRLAMRLGKRGREDVEQYFSLDQMVTSVLEVYHNVCHA